MENKCEGAVSEGDGSFFDERQNFEIAWLNND